MISIRVWDLPTRMFHGLFAADARYIHLHTFERDIRLPGVGWWED